MTYPDERPGWMGEETAGTSQAARLLPDLLPTYLHLDGRTLPELLAYLAGFSGYVQFYTASDQGPQGSWALATRRHTLLLATLAGGSLPAGPARAPRHRAELLAELRLIRQAAAELSNGQYYYRLHEQQSAQPHRSAFGQLLAEVLLPLRARLLEAASYEAVLHAERILRGPRVLPASFVDAFGTGRQVLQPTGEAPGPPPNSDDASWRGVAEADDLGEALHQVLLRFRHAHTAVVALADQTLRRELQLANNHQPEVGLLVAFAQLFRYAQATLNDLPRRHLDYYYQTELGVPLQGATPDQVYVLLTPPPGQAQPVPGALPPAPQVPAGLLLDGGAAADGQPIVYATRERASLATWQVEELATLFVDTDTNDGREFVRGIYTATLAEQQPGAGIGPAVAPGWPLLGADPTRQPEFAPVMQPADVGFAVAASVLQTGPGRRRITLSIETIDESFWELHWKVSQLPPGLPLASMFRVQATQADGWLTLEPADVRLCPDTLTLTWVLTLGPATPALVGYQPAVHGGDLPTTQPIVRLLLNPQAPVFGYSFFATFHPLGVRVQVQADALTDFTLANQQGPLSADSAFYPFGAPALCDSYLELASPELQGKDLTQLTLSLTWQNLPPQGFGAYYQGYEPPLTEESFLVQVCCAKDYAWEKVTEQLLFQSADPASTIIPYPLAQTTVLPLGQLGVLEAAPTGAAVLRLQLAQPLYGFGDQLYASALTRVANQNAEALFRQTQLAVTWPLGPSPAPLVTVMEPTSSPPPKLLPLANPPLAPQLLSLGVSYQAEQYLDLTAPAGPDAPISLLHLQPFTRFEPALADRRAPLLPALPLPSGTLYVGLSSSAAGQLVSLVFGLSVPAAPDFPLADLSWAYLRADNGWEPIAADPSLGGELPGLANAVRVAVVLPADLPAGRHWLRARLPGQALAYGQLQAVYPRLVLAERVGVAGQAPAPYQQPLPAGTITQLLNPLPAVGAVVQPLPSFGGRVAETAVGPAYYTRVSEQLRHRNRALLPWDYERLLLARFPEILVARCLSASQLGMPGQVTALVLPAPAPVVATAAVTAAAALPHFSTGQLAAMQAALQPLMPPAVQLLVCNPAYELLQVWCDVTFGLAPGEAPYGYEQQLQQDLGAFLSPWPTRVHATARGFGSLDLTALAAFVQQLPYVREVSLLWVLGPYGGQQVIPTPPDATGQQLWPAPLQGVLASAPTHYLNRKPDKFPEHRSFSTDSWAG